MNALQVFTYTDHPVRVIDVNGAPFFVGKDVAAILGYRDTSDALKKHVDEEDKGVGDLPTPGGLQKVITINESGLYSLILQSKLPTARAFKHWVTAEVLPSIRKHGAYLTPTTMERVLADPDFGITLLQELKAERNKVASLETTVAVQTQQIAEMKPKVGYYDIVCVLEIRIPQNRIHCSSKTPNRYSYWLASMAYAVDRVKDAVPAPLRGFIPDAIPAICQIVVKT